MSWALLGFILCFVGLGLSIRAVLWERAVAREVADVERLLLREEQLRAELAALARCHRRVAEASVVVEAERVLRDGQP